MKAAKAISMQPAKEKDLTPVVLTADTLLSLVERMVNIERENVELRTLIKTTRADLSRELEDTRESIYTQCIPELTDDGRLRFKAYDDNANPILGIVQAELTAEES